MDFVIGLIVGLFFGGWVGLGIASAIVISRDKEAEERMNGDPDGSKAVMKDAIETLKRQGAPTCLTDDERRKELEERYRE